ncbi:hypothetical protein CMU86_11610 [Elizabethkingia anophelis]|nr:hypothetical protein [Elizabethkingia anophelis]
MTKHEAIKAAYGEFWERLSPFQQEYALAENGTVQIGYTEEQKKLFLDIRKSGLFNFEPTMPKSISGIGTNNGWTRIDSEEDLPKEYDVEYFCFHKDGRIIIRTFFEYLGWGEFDCEILDQSDITHYQPVQVPKPPIF